MKVNATVQPKPDKAAIISQLDVTGSNNAINVEECNNTQVPKGFFGQRHIFALMTFTGLTISYMLRVNLSVAIVDMVNRTRTTNQTLSGYLDEPTEENGEFDWDSRTQGLILGCFFWGYIVVQVPSGLIAERYSGKNVFGWSIFLTGIFNILTPIAARTNFTALIVVRVLTGAVEGGIFPSLSCMISRWVPEQERSGLTTFINSGLTFGTLVGLPLSGFLCGISWDNGWPLAFYVPGALAVVWFFFWIVLVFEDPDVHPRISPEEKQYIKSSTGRSVDNDQKKKQSIPWLAIFTSVPLWALLAAQVTNCWGFYVLLTKLPTYMKTVLNFDLNTNGLLSALPYLVKWILSVVFSIIADMLLRRKVLNVTQTRKVFTTIGLLFPGLALIGVAYTGYDRFALIALFIACIGINGGTSSGFTCNHFDLAPNHAAILMSIINGLGNICGFLAPYVVGVIVTDEESLSQWQLIFLLSAGIYIAGSLIYIMFASGEEQSWNRQKTAENTVESSNDFENEQ